MATDPNRVKGEILDKTTAQRPSFKWKLDFPDYADYKKMRQSTTLLLDSDLKVLKCKVSFDPNYKIIFLSPTFEYEQNVVYFLVFRGKTFKDVVVAFQVSEENKLVAMGKEESFNTLKETSDRVKQKMGLAPNKPTEKQIVFGFDLPAKVDEAVFMQSDVSLFNDKLQRMPCDVERVPGKKITVTIQSTNFHPNRRYYVALSNRKLKLESVICLEVESKTSIKHLKGKVASDLFRIVKQNAAASK